MTVDTTPDFAGETPVDGQLSCWHIVDDGIDHGRTTALCGASLVGVTEITPRHDIFCEKCVGRDG